GKDQYGTAFAVYQQPPQADGTRRALVMTNQHVAGAREIHRRDYVAFEGTSAVVKHLVASSEQLDYALVEVELPRGSNVSPVKLSTDAPRPDQRVYAVSGDALLKVYSGPVRHWVALPRAMDSAPPPSERGGAYTIQLGTVRQ